jgi:hypothetical protein
MNEHAGPACALSILIVGVFAVLLHDRGQPNSNGIPIAQKSSAAMPDHETQLDSPPVPTSERRAEVPSIVESSRPIESDRSSPPKSSLASRPAEEKPEPGGEGGSQPVQRHAARSPFTVVLSGEKLVDVATRVYGSADSTGDLWRANRDQVAQVDSVLARGTLLRTP